MEKYCISIDWLQVYCICNYLPENLIKDCKESDKEEITLELEEYSTALWINVYSVYQGALKVGTLCMTPRSSAMDSKGCTLKLENRVLYSQECVAVLYKIMSVCNLNYRGITRLDLCYDCNKLADGSSVQKFLYDYLTAAPYQEGHIIRVGSRRVSMHGRRSAGGAMEINSMRWGSPSSDIGAYCYNKSLELVEVKDKPWIRDAWERAGLSAELDLEGWNKLTDKVRKSKTESGDSAAYVKVPVWRFEISIKAHSKDLLNLDTGEIFRLSVEYLKTQEAVERLFRIYAKKAFHFRRSSGQTTIREYPDYEIFANSGVLTTRQLSISRYLDSGRSEKMCYNKLLKMSTEYADLSDAQRHSMQAAMDFILTVAGKKQAAIRLKREAELLRNFRAEKFMAYDDYLYLGSLEAARVARYDIDPEVHISFIRSLVESVKDECLRCDNVQIDGYPYGLGYSMPTPLYPPTESVHEEKIPIKHIQK